MTTQVCNPKVTTTAAPKIPSLTQGSKSQAVKKVQTLLRKWGYYPGPIDGLYSRAVTIAVKSFQHRVFLVEDGIVGTLTWQALHIGVPVNMPILQEGSRGELIITLQRLLKSTGDYRDTIDGHFGSCTKTAVQAFQKRFALVEDGVVGDRTWHVLSKVPH